MVMLGIFLGALSPIGYSQEEGAISYGMVKKHVKPGESTQVEILKLFGSPDNMVLKKGKETWVYDRFKVETSVSTESGYGTIILAGTKTSKMTTSTSVRNLTVIIEFTASGIVEDLSMRVGGY
jgi:hypothetical protein